jgi:hypothetical protein
LGRFVCLFWQHHSLLFSVARPLDKSLSSAIDAPFAIIQEFTTNKEDKSFTINHSAVIHLLFICNSSIIIRYSSVTAMLSTITRRLGNSSCSRNIRHFAASSGATRPTHNKQHQHPRTPNKNKVKSKWCHISGLSKFTTGEDMREIMSALATTSADKSDANIECILDDMMLPMGSWVVKTDADMGKKVVTSYFANKQSLYGKLTVVPVTDLSIYRTPSKFGIDSNTLLLYNIPRGIESEEINYVFEDIKFGKKGIQKVSFHKHKTISYLLYCATSEDADLAMLRSDGMCLAGNRLLMFRYH